MAKVATELNKLIAGRRVVEPDRLWWSCIWEATQALPNLIQYSPLLPEGTIITEVQVQAIPIEDHWVCGGILYLRVVGMGEVTIPQLTECEPVIPWAHWTPRYRWIACGKYINERWPCHKTMRGAERRLAWVAQAVDEWGFRLRVSVQYELP